MRVWANSLSAHAKINALRYIQMPRRLVLKVLVQFKLKEKKKMKSKLIFALCALCLMGATMVAAQKDPMVGGAAMFPTKNIVENAVNSADHTTLVAAVKAAGLVDTLESAGPFTVFAPTNEAFNKLPAGTVNELIKPENKAVLTKVLTYHVVAGKWSEADLMKQIKAGHGT